MTQRPPFRSYQLDLSSPKGWLAVLTFILASILAIASLIILLPAALLTGWYLKRKARHAVDQARAQQEATQGAHPEVAPDGAKVLDASDYKVE